MPFFGGVVANELNCGNGGPPNSFQTGSKTLAMGERTLGGSIRGEKRKGKLPEACSFAELAVLYIKSNSFVTSWLTIQVNIFMAITSIN